MWEVTLPVQLTARKNPTDLSLLVHLDKRNKQHDVRSNSSVELYRFKALDHRFQKQHGHVLCLHYNDNWTAREIVQGDAFYEAGTDWLKTTCMKEGDEGSATNYI